MAAHAERMAAEAKKKKKGKKKKDETAEALPEARTVVLVEKMLIPARDAAPEEKNALLLDFMPPPLIPTEPPLPEPTCALLGLPVEEYCE